jgi:uncharacterized protein
MTPVHVIAMTGAAVIIAYVVMISVVAHRFTTPKRVSPPRLPDALAPRFERVQFAARADTVRIAAWYRTVSSSTAAVIMVHGRDGCRGDELRGDTFLMAERIAAAGMSVVMMDLRGHGDSDGARLTFGHHESRDVLGAVDFLLARGYQPARIGIFGASMGGVSGIAAAATEPAIGAVVTDSAFADLDDVLRLQFRRLTRLPVCCLRGALVVARLLTGVNLTARAPHRLVRAMRGRPMLVIHAAGDPFVPVRHAHLLADAGQAACWITPGTRHLASAGAVGARYAEVVADFFAEALGMLAPPATARLAIVQQSIPASYRERCARATDVPLTLLAPVRRRRSRR